MILCGGSSKIPKLQSRIKSLFEDAEILNTINPDEVIAVGAAKQASLLPEVNILEISKDIYYRNFLVGNFDWKDDCSYDVISALKFSSLKNFMYPIVFKKNFRLKKLVKRLLWINFNNMHFFFERAKLRWYCLIHGKL